jgi:hypothetical protein
VDEVTASLLGGLLGGGVTGALIGGLITLFSQARSHRREDRFRFNDAKREKYAALYTGVDEWFIAVVEWYWHLSGESVKMEPPAPVGEPEGLRMLATEALLLGDSRVVRAASALKNQIDEVDRTRKAMALAGIGAFLTPEGLRAHGLVEDPRRIALLRSMDVVNDFFHAARQDIGTDRANWLARSVQRVRETFRRPRR